MQFPAVHGSPRFRRALAATTAGRGALVMRPSLHVERGVMHADLNVFHTRASVAIVAGRSVLGSIQVRVGPHPLALSWLTSKSDGPPRPGSHGVLLTLRVLGAMRGFGFGRWLLHEAVRVARDEGADTVYLEAQPFDRGMSLARLVRFYEDSGFALTGSGTEMRMTRDVDPDRALALAARPGA